MKTIALVLLVLLKATTASADEAALRVVAAARAQIGVTVLYDPSYRSLAYPGGDVPQDRGVCTDVVIRAYRQLGLDLQVAVHEDMKKAWRAYPKLWGLSGPDKNIDHRRVPNLATYLRRTGASLPLGDDPDSYLPGDMVTWQLPSGVPHIGIVSDGRTGKVPLVIHNIGAGAVEEDVLFGFQRSGHYRLALDARPTRRFSGRQGCAARIPAAAELQFR